MDDEIRFKDSRRETKESRYKFAKYAFPISALPIGVAAEVVWLKVLGEMNYEPEILGYVQEIIPLFDPLTGIGMMIIGIGTGLGAERAYKYFDRKEKEAKYHENLMDRYDY